MVDKNKNNPTPKLGMSVWLLWNSGQADGYISIIQGKFMRISTRDNLFIDIADFTMTTWGIWNKDLKNTEEMR